MAKTNRVNEGAVVRKNTVLGPIFLVGGGVLIILSVVLWQLFNYSGVAASQPNPLPSVATPQEKALQTPYPQVSRVSLTDANSAYASQRALFVDVRDAGSYATSHIKGAINIPLISLETRTNELPKDRWIITYCTEPAENYSAGAADLLIAKGFSNVTPLKGGFETWVQAGYPVEP